MKRYLSLWFMAFIPFMLIAQNNGNGTVNKSFDELRKSLMNDFQKSKKGMEEEFQSFRQKVMQEYIDFVRKAWAPFEKREPVPLPKEKPLPPVVVPDEIKVLPIDDKPMPIKGILPPINIMPQPQPIEPIEEIFVEVEKSFPFTFFGTEAKVRFDVADKVVLKGVSEKHVADALERMSKDSHENLIVDCLRLRDMHSLSDWAYINMLDALSKKIYGNDVNSATLLMAYIYMQSGYKMRFATDKTRLYMLYASMHNVYELPCFVVDDVRYYSLEELPLRLNISSASYEKETPLSLIVATNQKFAYKPAAEHHVKSHDYPDFAIDVTVNENLLDFYKNFPTSMVGENMYSRWAIYANTPTDVEIAETLYPQFKEMLDGLSELDAVSRILNLVQTGFEYKYDDDVWGGDRIFFPDECFYYSYNDCDDRSVLFSRLVRDIMGLDACLVFVPGHVLVGVEFKENVKGSFVMIGNRKFVLCEPTCTNGAPVGWSEVKDDADLNVYLLER